MSRQITTNDIISYKVEANFAGDNPDYEYITDWGDGSIDTTVGNSVHYIAHQYSSAGTYSPKVTIKDKKKGCWKVFDLDTVYVLGITITSSTVVQEAGSPVVLSFSLNGSYDVESGSAFAVKTKWYFGDGTEGYWSSEINITSMPYTGSVVHTYSEEGTYSAWVAFKVTTSSQENVLTHTEISNCLQLLISDLAGGGTFPEVGGSVSRTDTAEGSTRFSFIVNSGTGPFSITADWGDGTTSTYENVPITTEYNMSHSFPSSQGATIYTPVFTVTDSAGITGIVPYTIYISPKLALIPSFGGTALASGVSQSTIIYAGKGPYAVYFDISIQENPSAESTPKCRVKVVADNTKTTYYPNSASWYGAGAQMFAISDVVSNFTIELDHNLSVDSFNSMLIRAYAIDSNGSVSGKVNLVRFGRATNIEATGV